MNKFKCLNLQFLFTYHRLLNCFKKFHAHVFLKKYKFHQKLTCRQLSNEKSFDNRGDNVLLK